MPRLDTRLCLLLSITTLVVANLITEDEEHTSELECNSTNHWKEKRTPGKRRNDLVSSLQILGEYHGLLSPPQSVVSVANQAAAKAMMFVSGINVGNGYFDCVGMNDIPISCCKYTDSHSIIGKLLFHLRGLWAKKLQLWSKFGQKVLQHICR